MTVDIPENIAIGRRNILSLPGCEILEDLRWEDRLKMWVLRIRITVGTIPSVDSLIMPTTNWWVAVSSSYPYGALRIYPDKVDGITTTFQHQRFNADTTQFPWRPGEICVNTSLSKLWRKGFTQEPFTAMDRLRWHLGRAMEWINAAIRDELTAPGEPFELPPLPSYAKGLLAFNEDQDTLVDWEAKDQISGLFSVKHLSLNENILVMNEFRTKTDRIRYSWGVEISAEKDRTWEGIWVRLPSLPILDRWQIPVTWDQLFQFGFNRSVDIKEIVINIYSRSGPLKYLALGFPIPARFGDAPERMHWFAASIGAQPKLTGFRKGSEDYLRACAKTLFATGKKIDWINTENWSRQQISARGRATATLQNSNIVIIGAGAIGSQLSEMLLRLGCTKMTIVDDQVIEIGNLARHNLTMEDIGGYKSEMLAGRLNCISPNASIKCLALTVEKLIETNPAILQEAKVIIDATASDEVIHSISNQVSGKGQIFISLSNGFGANRLFCFASMCPPGVSIADAFFEKLSPWIRREREENDKIELPWEGAGCWHPIFPARLDDIVMLLGAVVKPIEEYIDLKKTFNLLIVQRALDENGNFVGLKLIRE